MGGDTEKKDARVEPLRRDDRPTPVSDDLRKLIASLNDEFMDTVSISFEFENDLRLHIDFRKREHALLAEAKLPALCGGIFSKIMVGDSPHHPFFHRVSAIVDR